MLSFTKVLSAVALTLVTVSASAETTVSEWRQSRLKSADGVEITVDYQIVHDYYMSNKPTITFKLSPVIINVSSAKAGANIRAVLLNNVKASGCGRHPYWYQEAAMVDLKSAPEGHQYANLTSEGRRRRTFGTEFDEPVGPLALAVLPYCMADVSFGQELGIVVDGHWLIDPVSGSTNFKLDLGGDVASAHRR